jgi:amino acid permease
MEFPQNNYDKDLERKQLMNDSDIHEDAMEVIQVYNPQTKRMMQRFVIMLVAVGLVIGTVLSVGVIYVLDKVGWLTPPNQRIERQQPQQNFPPKI